MPWLQITVRCAADQVEHTSEVLLQLTAQSITCRDAQDTPLFEPGVGEMPLWQQTCVTGLFDAGVDLKATLSAIQQATGTPVAEIQHEILEDKDWIREWMQYYQPMQFGEHLWIVPSHLPPPDPDATNLFLDPGLAFGTGTHPTTAMCLRWLCTQDLQDKIVVDYGCGSGVLGIAAALLGAAHIYAIDNDPQALLATRSNAEHNQVTDKITCLTPEQAVPHAADVIVANILAQPLIDLAAKITGLMQENAIMALSGILASQQQMVVAAYQPYRHLRIVATQEEWVCLAGE